MGIQRVKEVTNHDMLSYDKRKTGLDALMPSNEDQEQSNKFAPGYIQEQQSKHEDIIKQKQGLEDNLSGMDDNLKRKLNKPDEEIELKHKVGGPEAKNNSGMQMPNYTLTDFNDQGNPTILNVYEKNSDGSLKCIVSYNISGMDTSRWTGGTKDIGKNGEKVLASYSNTADITGLGQTNIVETVFYAGSKGSEAIDYILSGYVNGVAGQVTLYGYDASGTLTGTRTYNTNGIDSSFKQEDKSQWAGSLTDDKLVSSSVYTGSKGNEKISQTFYYNYDNGILSVTEKDDYIYNGDALTGVFVFNTDGMTDQNKAKEKISDLNGDGIIDEKDAEKWAQDNGVVFDNRSIFTGAAGEEHITETIYYNRNPDGSYRVDQTKYFTYDSNGTLISDSLYDAAGNLINEEKYTGSKGYEKVSWSLLLGEISPGQTTLPDPISDEFLTNAQNNGAAIVYYGNGALHTITFSDGTVYTYNHENADGSGTINTVVQTKNGAIVNTFIYSNGLLSIVNSGQTTTLYTYNSITGYLDYTMTLVGPTLSGAAAGDVIQSYTKFDSTNNQRQMQYTWSFKGNTTLTAETITADNK